MRRSDYCVAMVLFAVAGCSADEPEGQGIHSIKHAVEIAEPSFVRDGPHGERPGVPPVTFRWNDESPSRIATTLEATITNNTENETFAVLVKAQGGSPTEHLRELLMGHVELPPKASELVSIEVDSLPIQSVGTWASITLAATYLRRLESGEREQGAATNVLHVTSDSTDWKRPATVRTGDEQDRVDTKLYLAGARPRPSKLRMIDEDAETLRFVEVATESLTMVYGINAPPGIDEFGPSPRQTPAEL